MPLTHACLLTIALLGALGSAVSAQGAGPRKVLVIDLDDLGIELLQATPTPHLDSLAAQGRYFSRFYAAPMCTPARVLAQLGARGSRIEVRCIGNVQNTNDYRLPTAPFTPLGVRVQTSGKRAMKIGKWHLCSDDTLAHPTAFGWLPYVGVMGNLGPAGGDWFNYPENAAGTSHSVTNTYLTTRETDLALRAVHDGYDLISLSYHAPHKPFHDPPSYLHTIPLPLVFNWDRARAALQALDTELARLTPMALALGYTVIIYSDNGLAATLGGDKGTVYEGGVRTMLWALGPGIVPGQDDSVIELVDLYATVLALLGIPQGPLAGPDSVSFEPLLVGGSAPGTIAIAERGTLAGADPHLQPDTWRRMACEQRFKLIVNQDLLMPRLFDLQNDPGEQVDLLAGPSLSNTAAQAFAALRAALAGL